MQSIEMTFFNSAVQARKVASHLKKHSGGHGYTDQDNPFGVWGKKLEKQIQSGVNVKELGAKAEKRRQEERLVSGCTSAHGTTASRATRLT